MNISKVEFRNATIAAVISTLAACGGGGGGGGGGSTNNSAGSGTSTPPATTYTIGGTVSGLGNGAQLILANNGGDDLTVSTTGTFTFTTAIVSGASYAVTVNTQPVGQNCAVASGSATGIVANISTVAVTCSAATESTLVNFAGNISDGGTPESGLILAGDGNFYGTTTSGGAFGGGTVFKITPAGVETTIYSFGATVTDGEGPSGALIQGSDGNFYGTTVDGGAGSAGTVYKVTPAGVETVLHSFANNATDGGLPYDSLIQGSDGNFYGTTDQGGASNNGTVFKITPAGVETMLYSFGTGTTDGVNPNAALVQTSDGNFYSTTGGGGANGGGTFFKITPAGVETVLYSFGAGAGDGVNPGATPILASDGNFYGTTDDGGTGSAGIVYKITPAGVETVLHSFGNNATDGGHTFAALIQANDGNFYGTTGNGGAGGAGTIFKITPAGVETVLYSFANNTTDGGYPNGGLIQGSDGYLYGTAQYAGANSAGTVFRY